MKRIAKERIKNKLLKWNKIDKQYFLKKELFYIYGAEDFLDVKIKGYYNNDVICLLNFHISERFVFHPLNNEFPFTYFKKLILEPIIDGLNEKKIKGKIGFEKIEEFEQLNNYVRIMLTRNKIQFEENDKFIYVEIN